METRIKWYSSPQITPALIKELAGVMRQNAFTPNSERGFIISSTRPGAVSGKYIEKFEGKRIFNDPLGNRIELPFVTFESVEFRISCIFPQFEILEPPRSLKKMSMFLGELISTPFSIQPISTNSISWVEALSADWGKITIKELRCDNLVISSSLAADMVFSGSGDTLTAAKKYLGKNFGQVSYIRAEFNLGNRTILGQFSSNAAAKINCARHEGLLVSMRAKLAELSPTKQ